VPRRHQDALIARRGSRKRIESSSLQGLGRGKAVFLDRDGVINRSLSVEGKPVAPRTFSEFRLLRNARGNISALKRHGFEVAVVTNQPDVAKGLIALSELERMNRRLLHELEVDIVKVCLHAQEQACGCRKPAPGMLLAAAEELGISTGKSYMVGDRWSDVEAGRAAGCYTIKIERRWANERPSQPHAIVGSLTAAVRHILAREKRLGKERRTGRA
jgi:D-glycero-D-manno-heptose 1,7-bisphosphate phosphatase